MRFGERFEGESLCLAETAAPVLEQRLTGGQRIEGAKGFEPVGRNA